jgi:hypothetical protein
VVDKTADVSPIHLRSKILPPLGALLLLGGFVWTIVGIETRRRPTRDAA